MAGDAVDDFIALPQDQQLTTLQALAPDKQSKLLDAVRTRRSQAAPPAPAAPPDSTAISAQPSAFSPAGIMSKAYTARDWIINQLPAIGGTVGGLATLETGPGSLVGAAAGGVLGEDAKQVINEHLHPTAPKMSAGDAALHLAGQGLLQGANELGGKVVGTVAAKALAPIAERFPTIQKYPAIAAMFGYGEKTSPQAAERLTAAAATPGKAGQVLDNVGRTISDIEQEVRKLPASGRTVQGFLDSVNARKDAMNVESGLAMQHIAGQQIVPTGVSNNILGLIRPYMANTAQGRAERAAIQKAAAEYQKPWSFRELDALRTDLASQLSKHNTQGSVARYAAQKGDLNLAIDNAVEDGLRDAVYPAMDRAAGKPAGYFSDLKGRQSSLIQLQDVLEKRIADLKGAQAVTGVAPKLASENLSVSAHPGYLPTVRLHGLRNMVLGPTRVLDQADKQVGKAFPNVNALPYEALFSGGIRASQVQPPAPRQQEKNATDAYANQ